MVLRARCSVFLGNLISLSVINFNYNKVCGSCLFCNFSTIKMLNERKITPRINKRVINIWLMNSISSPGNVSVISIAMYMNPFWEIISSLDPIILFNI